jgi:hypothetical protein
MNRNFTDEPLVSSKDENEGENMNQKTQEIVEAANRLLHEAMEKKCW